MTDFGTAMALTPIGERRWSATVTPDWGNGRTTFGGLVEGLPAEQGADGHATGYASLCQDGRLVAWSEQLVAVFDRPAAALAEVG